MQAVDVGGGEAAPGENRVRGVRQVLQGGIPRWNSETYGRLIDKRRFEFNNDRLSFEVCLC